MALQVSVGSIVLSLFLMVLGGTFVSMGSDMFGPLTLFVGIVGLVLSLIAARPRGVGRRLAELDRLVQRGILEPEERDRKRDAILEAA